MNTSQIPAELIRMLAQMSGRAGGAMGSPGMPPMGAPGGTPPFLPRGASPATSAAPAYNVKNDPMANVGSLQPPRPPRPPTEIQGSGPVGTLISLLGNWHSSKKKNEQEEAARASENLMQAIEGAKTTGDWTPAYTILHNNEKLFNKVYKGWLQQSDIQQKEASKKQREPEPDVQGFEQGVKSYLDKKQKGGAGPGTPAGQTPSPIPPTGSAPRSMGGYLIPQAPPQQALAQQATSTERQATQQDPARTLSSQLTSGEGRQAELGSAGLAVTPKIQAELDKYQASITEAQYKSQKAELELKTAQQKALTSGQRDEASLAKLKTQASIESIKLDIEKQKLLNQRAKLTGLKSVSQGFQLKWQMINKVEDVLKQMVANKGGIDKSNVVGIANLLKNAGATSLATDLMKQQQSLWTNYGFGKYSTPDELLKGIADYKDAFKKAFIDAKEQASPTEKETPEGAASEGDDEGETMDFEYDAEGNRVTTPKP